MKKCGYIALVGRPNAGKSTLLNALVGSKLAAVSRKPQTTRNRILGVISEGDTQLVFLDTPGIHKSRGTLLNSTMNRVAYQTAAEADLIVYLVDIERGWEQEDDKFLQAVLAASSARVLVVASQIDKMDKLRVRATIPFIDMALEKYRDRLADEQCETVSAKWSEDVAMLRERLADLLPEGDWLFAEDDLTDLSESFICSELIREQMFRQLGKEVPYGIAVKIASMDRKPELTVINAVIVVERPSQKAIVLGKAGARIKQIGTQARLSLEKQLGQKVFLDLVVNVASGWTDDQRLIAELAHLQDFDETLRDLR